MKRINENQKVTLTLGQLKRLVMESADEKWCVIRLGKGRSWETISNMYGSESCVITDDNLSKEEARASAKEQAKELPDSLKNMYGWSFKAVPMSAVKEIEKAKGDWCVVSFGGSIGKNHKYHCRYGACSIESDNLTQDDAKEEAKESRKYRTSTDKYYGITYRALPRSDVKDNE